MRRRRALAGGILLAVVSGASPAGAVPSVDEVLRGIGFTEADVARIRRGEMVKGVMDSTSERELAIKLAFLVRAPQSDLHELFLARRDYAYDPSVIGFAAIEGDGSLSDFSTLHLDPHADAMARAYLGAEPGSELNLSREEIAAFAALPGGRGSAAREQVEEQIRKALLARFRAYRLAGLDGIAPYARGGGQDHFPGRELRRQTEREEGLARYAPEFHRALLEYPSSLPEDVEERLHWVSFRIDDKPTLSLVHRMDHGEGSVRVFAERHFYVSRSHDSVQAIGGAFPVEGGTLVLYVNRTSTDQVGGFGSAARRALGERVMTGQIAEVFERMREAEAKVDQDG